MSSEISKIRDQLVEFNQKIRNLVSELTTKSKSVQEKVVQLGKNSQTKIFVEDFYLYKINCMKALEEELDEIDVGIDIDFIAEKSDTKNLLTTAISNSETEMFSLLEQF